MSKGRLPPLGAVALSLAAASAGASSAVDATPVRTDHLLSQLVAQTTAAVPGQALRIGLLLQHDPHWHTYWRNPGDSGLPTRIELELPTGVTASAIEWPAPWRFDVEGIVNFGYGDRILLPITLQLPADLGADPIEIVARASWLICEVECIPGRGEYRLSLPVVADAQIDARWRDAFATAQSRQPQPLDGRAQVSRIGERIAVDIRSSDLPPDIAAWSIFPATAQVIVNGAWPTWTRIDGGLRMLLPQSESFAGLPDRFDLVLVKDDQARSINAELTPAP